MVARLVIARTSAVNGNRHCVFRYFLGDSHVASLLGMTFGAVAITAMPFEQFIRSIAFTTPSFRADIEMKNKEAVFWRQP